MDSDAISDISEVTSKSSSKRSRFSRSAKRSKDKSKDSHRKNQGTIHSVFGRGSKNSSSSNSVSTPNGNTSNPSTSLPSLDDTEVVGSAEDVVAGITGDQEDPSIRFAGEGVTFKAKLIGIDPVSSPRGDAMCKNAMLRLKAIVKGTGAHKKKILLSISLSGLTLMDEKSKETISHHPIPLISYISRDTSDSRAFGFVYGTPHDGHQFIGIKTEKAAIPVMQTIADLFTYVYEKRKKEKSSNGDQAATTTTASALSFSAKEEFSEQKVNAAWSKTEPSDVPVSSNLDDTLGIQVNTSKLSSQSSNKLPGQLNSQFNNSSLPTLLPPPLAAFRAPSSLASDSRTSTLSSIQRSDVLNELRSMRHVINSANAAAASNSSSSGIGSTYDRYATWESFQENDYCELTESTSSVQPPPPPSSVTSTQPPIPAMVNFSHSYESNASGSLTNSTNSMMNRSAGIDHNITSFIGGTSSDFSVLENRPGSARSSGRDSLDKASNSSPLSIYSSRIGVGQLRGPIVSTPPSSPRSTAGSFNSGSSTMSKARARPRRGFEQPNQVALPPPSAFTRNQPPGAPVRLGSFSSTSSSSNQLPPANNLPVRPSNTSAGGGVSNSTVASLNTFPSSSEPDLFASFTLNNSTRDVSSNVSSGTQAPKSDDVDKFEVNFDAIFPPFTPSSSSSSGQQPLQLQARNMPSTTSLPPPPPPSHHTKQVSFSSLSHASFDSQSNSVFPATDIFDTFNGQKETSKGGTSSSYTSSSSSSSSTGNADRYACFKEIQELANISSVFDQTSSGSDSDTFVGSPPSLMSTNDSTVSKVDTINDEIADTPSLFDVECDKITTDNWVDNVTNSFNATTSTYQSTVPLSSANDDEKDKSKFNFVHNANEPFICDDKFNLSSNTHDTTVVEKSSTLFNIESVATDIQSAPATTKYKDTATSPGTPPHLHSNENISSHEILHNSQNSNQNHSFNSTTDEQSTQNAKDNDADSTNKNAIDDPFGMKSLLQDLNRIDLEVTATFEASAKSQTATKGPESASNSDKVDTEGKTNDEPVQEKRKQKSSFSQSQTSPLNVTDRPPSTLSSTSSFRNPFTDDDDSEYATSTGGHVNPFKHSTSNISTTSNDTPGPFGQPAWPSMYDHRMYDHMAKQGPMICPSHAFHDQQSHIYFAHTASTASASYVMPSHPSAPPPPPPPSAAQVCAHGCACQGYSAPGGGYPCWPAPHPMYCQMHPPGIAGHPMACVYCRPAAPPYHHHPHAIPHPQAAPQPQLQPPPPAPTPLSNVPPSLPASSATAPAVTSAPAAAAATPAAVTSQATAPLNSTSHWPNQHPPPLGPTEFGSSFDFDEDPISPTERNIFQHKDDPFADDDFFAQ